MGANEEQLQAIKSSGNVLLEAGAGSGKTFVIVEHLFYSFEKLIKKYQFEKNSSDKIKRELSKFIVITFTNKAASELIVRIKKKAILRKEKEEEGWNCIFEGLSYIYIGTIHGLCYRLLSKGLFSKIGNDLCIVNDSQQFEKIESIIESWPVFDSSSQNKYLLHLNDIKGTLKTIFSDAQLRKTWSESFQGDNFNFWDHLLKCQQFSLLKKIRELINSAEDSNAKYLIPLVKLQRVIDAKIPEIDFLKAAIEIFEEHKRITKPSKKLEWTECEDTIDQLKIFRALVIKHEEALTSYFSNEGEKFWPKLMKDVFLFVQEHYLCDQKLTFGDLEYYTYLGLLTSKIEKHYVIVDEFQDTSLIQFDIIEKLTGRDRSYLFCVGDAKQAIYGFRGGEVSVFYSVKEKLENKLYLKNNYRSSAEVVEFNNNFFNFLFPLGIGFEGKGENILEGPKQIPQRSDLAGDILSIQGKALGDKKSSEEMNLIEATYIGEYLLKNDSKECVVLYKTLKPSQYLIDFLIRKGVSFTAQVKIAYSDDPLMGIFSELIEYSISKNIEKSIFFINNYLSLLGKSEGILAKQLDDFEINRGFFGIQDSWCQFLLELCIRVANTTPSFHNILEICLRANDDIHKLYRLIKSMEGEVYSVDFQYGKTPEQIVIMSAHASKGLEFSEVILGGIYTNGRSFERGEIVGKLPGSYKWKNPDGRDYFQSPQYILEQLYAKNKNFGESKRLFYVACTRAKERLTWVNLEYDKSSFPTPKNSWIQGLRKFNQSPKEVSVSINTKIDKKVRVPHFHKNQVSMFCDDNIEESTLVHIPELSVTKFSLLSGCPKRFYLKNVVNLDLDDLEELNIEIPKDKDGTHYGPERGTQIHNEIENYLKTSHLGKKFKKIIKYFESELLPYNDFKKISEKEIRFPVFNIMVSGIPDLILEKEGNFEIWDYKTGKTDELIEKKYWSQLLTYAYGYYELKLVDKNRPIKISILYLDLEERKIRTICYDDVLSFVNLSWKNLGLPMKEDNTYCDQCPYLYICQK